MPTTTTKGITYPNGNENATRISITNAFDNVNEQFSQEQLLVRPADVTYAAPTLSVFHGVGQIRFASGFRSYAAGTTTFNAPAAATAYILIAKSDGTFYIRAEAGYATTTGEVVLYRITTANPVANGTSTLVDLRGKLPSMDAVAPSGVTAATYGSGSAIPVLTVDATGRVTLVTLAGIVVPANSVGASQIIDGSVGLAELAPNSVDASKIVDGSVGTVEIANGAITPAKLNLTGTLSWTGAGVLELSTGATQGEITNGTGGFKITNAGRSADNFVVTNAGAATIRTTLTVANQITVTGLAGTIPINLPFDANAHHVRLSSYSGLQATGAGAQLFVSSNSTYDGANFRYITNFAAAQVSMSTGTIAFQVAPTGGAVAGTVVPWVNAMTIANDGAVTTVGAVSVGTTLAVTGVATFSGAQINLAGAGVLLRGTTTGGYISVQPGTGGFFLVNNAGTFNNIVVTDAGVMTVRGGVGISGGGLTVAVGGASFAGTLGTVAVAPDGANITMSRAASNFIYASAAGGSLNLGVVANTSAISIGSTGAVVLGASLSVVTGGASIVGGMAVAGGLTVSSSGFAVTGASSLSGGLNITSGGLIVVGATSISGGGLTVSGGLSLGGGLTFSSVGQVFATTNGGTFAEYGTFTNTGGTMYVGLDNSAATTLFAGGAYYGGIQTPSGFVLRANGGNTIVTIDTFNQMLLRARNFIVSDPTGAASAFTVDAVSKAAQFYGATGFASSIHVDGPSSIGGATQASTALTIASSFALSGPNQRGVEIAPFFTSSATNTGAAVWMRFATDVGSSFNMAAGYGFYVERAQLAAGTSVTTLYGGLIKKQPHMASGSINLFIEDNETAADYSLWVQGQTRFDGGVFFSGTSKLGFYGTAPIVQQVVPTASSTATLIAALQAMGLVRQS